MTRTLILGGTGWLGREIASRLLDRGEEVTCLARGTTGAVAEGARLIMADREKPDAYREVSAEHWDEVIELAWQPTLVTGALASLASRAAHWTLVSSISAYAANDEPGADENAALLDGNDPDDYRQAKAAAERASVEALGDRLLIARPGLIGGPGDPSDRFGYWVSRFALAAAGPVLVPASPETPVQVIDVRDLAAWIAEARPRPLTGAVNAVGTVHTLDAVLRGAAAVANHSGPQVPADEAWLREREVGYWAGPRSLPLWLPPEAAALAQRSRDRYVALGGTERPLHRMLADVLEDEHVRGLDRPRRSGLSRSDELALLDEWRARPTVPSPT